MYTPPPADDNDQLNPRFNPATEDSASYDSPIDESFDHIPMEIDFPEPKFNSATEDAAAEDEELPADE